MDETNCEHNVTDFMAEALEGILQIPKCKRAGKNESCRKLERTI
jgi:hypothetical protein